MTVETMLTYAAPPLLGALIGYVTNYIAIRMLFRPLRPWRLFGLRLPMTPGIIPAKRGELAQRMGEMVGHHLLTAEDVVRTLEQESFQRELKTAVSEKLRNFLDRELGSAASLVPAPYRSRYYELVDLIGAKIATTVTDYLQQEKCAERLHRFTQEKIKTLLALDLEQCITPQQYDQARSHVAQLFEHYLSSPALADAVGRYVDERTDRLLRSEQPLRKLLPNDLVAILLDQLEKEIPPLLEKFGGMLYDPEFRKRLIVRIRQGIEKFLDSLGGLAGLLSGFVDLEKLYARIPEILDQISEEVAQWLQEEKTQAQVAALLRERIETFLDKPLAGYVEKLPFEKVDGVRRFIRDRAVELVQSQKSADTLLVLIEKGVQQIKGRSFASLCREILSEGGPDRLLTLVEENVLSLLRSDRVKTEIEDFVKVQVRSLLCDKQLGRLAARLPADVNEELEVMLYQQLSEVLKKEVPVLVETLKIEQMVEQKVNSLDLLEVEGLLLGVMQEQFKYINLFGALLGFLIGLANLLLLQLRSF